MDITKDKFLFLFCLEKPYWKGRLAARLIVHDTNSDIPKFNSCQIRWQKLFFTWKTDSHILMSENIPTQYMYTNTYTNIYSCAVYSIIYQHIFAYKIHIYHIHTKTHIIFFNLNICSLLLHNTWFAL